jgi:hypothetical protein
LLFGVGQPQLVAWPFAGLAHRLPVREQMKQNNLYLIIGALFVAVIALGVYVYREETQPKGVELRIDESGISVQQK